MRGGALQEAEMERILTTIAAWLSFNLMLPPLYDDATRTLYLPTAWTAASPTELSVLLHAMVHHVQNVAGMIYTSPQEREKLACAAQRLWLALFRRDLMDEFRVDRFTLLVRTNCIG
jgi:hypothetical protein